MGWGLSTPFPARLGRRALGGLLPGFLVLLACQALVARRRRYLPDDPGYRIDALVPAPGGAGEEALRLAVVGDSTVAGLGSPTAEEALPLLVARRVAAALDRPVHVVGAGVSGARTADLLAAQLPEVLPSGPAVLVAVVGANDVTHLTPPWRLARHLRALAAEVGRRSGAPVVLAGVPRFSGIAALREPLRAVVDGYARVLRRTQRRIARRTGMAFVEIARDASPRFAGVPDAMSWDGFHPAPVGYGFWADAIAPAVVEALRSRAARSAAVAPGG